MENSDLDLANNSGTEVDTEEKEPIRSSERLTKTNPIVGCKNPFCHDYRKLREKTEVEAHTESTKSSTREGKQQPLDWPQDQNQTLRPVTNRSRPNCQEWLTVHQTLDPWRNDRHNRKQNAPISRSPANSRRGNVEDRQTYLDSRN